MGCNHSKEATAVVVEVDDAHLRRRSRAKLKLDVAYHAQQYQYRQDQPLKLPVRCSSDSANDKPTPQPPSLTRTPAVTPHAAEESYSPVLSTTEYGSAISRKADEVCASDRLDFTNGAHVANSRYREPAACRGSTAELSNSEGSGEDHAGRERESEGEGKRVGEGKGGMATAAAGVAREAFLGDRSGAGQSLLDACVCMSRILGFCGVPCSRGLLLGLALLLLLLLLHLQTLSWDRWCLFDDARVFGPVLGVRFCLCATFKSR